ncbi:immunoglobulin-like domain-containing protein [Bacillus massiliigorillae]|uniref:immunoglobulin-like domain-containing protein n=1 Tax=Bacillus massiliigorillae TaxID=1243664 RepID=UPI0005A6A10B|nr:immunoglobulin-like domain-containing protein [Bacillus massiliigorillae]
MIKHYLVIFCFIALFLILIGCQSNDSLTEEVSTQIRPNSVNGITISTEKVKYSTSSEIITVLIQNNSNKTYTTGIHIFLEKKVGDLWYEVPMKTNDFTEQGRLHPSGELSSLSLKVDDLRYKLTSGKYRATINELAAPFEVKD